MVGSAFASIVGRRIPAALLALLAFAVSAPAWADRPTVKISIDRSGPSTRLVFTHSRKVTKVVLVDSGMIEVLYAEPVTVNPPRMRLDDGILAGWEMRGEYRLVLEPGPGYQRYESFELRNPERLILDLQGNRTRGRGGIVRSHPAESPKTVIVIDPGHGGSEFGAIGPTGLREKEVALDLARRLRHALQKDRSVSVVLTRSDDRRVDFDERTAIANHNQADLFISIHLNASPRRGAYGAETYFLSTEATDDEARTLAALENRAFGEGDPPGSSDGEQRSLDLLLWDLAQNRYLEQSSTLAESVQAHLNELTGTRDRGVRQAPFRVLMGATMPAILVEAGFISNPDEEARFRGLSYRNRVVEAIANAVNEFRRSLEQLTAPTSESSIGSSER